MNSIDDFRTIPASDDELEKDHLFHILQNGRRRAVLRYLLSHDATSFELGDIAEAVAAWENDVSVRQVTSTQRQRVYISLYQNHLPKLSSYGVVEYDQPRGTVEPTPRVEQFAPYLEAGSCALEGSEANDDSSGTMVARERVK